MLFRRIVPFSCGDREQSVEAGLVRDVVRRLRLLSEGKNVPDTEVLWKNPFFREVVMWKQVVQLLGVVMMLASGIVSAQAGEIPFNEFSVGEVNLRVMSLVQKDLNSSILMPSTEEQKKAVAAAYPDGAIHNVLNVLLIRVPGAVALVDTGYDWTDEQMDEALRGAGLGREDVTHIIITHAHGDHVGGLVKDGKPAFSRAVVLFPERELTYWTSPENRKSASGGALKIFDNVANIAAAYKDRMGTFEAGENVCAALPGVLSVDEAGHTPGHVGIMVSAEGKTFVFWSDLLHAFDVQAAHPAVSASFDMDPAAAARVREDMLNRARKEGWQVTGSHVPFTGPRVLK